MISLQIGFPDVTASVAASASARTAVPAQAVKDFESLFIETLLQSSGLAQTLDTQGGPEGGMAGELLVRELARGLAASLQLNFGRSLGIDAIASNTEETVTLETQTTAPGSRQKPRLLPAETQLRSEKAPQATFSN
jgi:hypothetical protein